MVLRSFAKRILRTKFLTTIFEGMHNGWKCHRYDQYRQNYDIHEDFLFNGDGILFYGDGEIVAKQDTYVGRYSQIQSVEDYNVVIGENCSISHFIKIYTSNKLADQDLSQPDTKYSQGNVIIGDDVWIGASVFITEDVEIGDNAVIGANSVVTRDIPSHTIAAGAPAKVQKFKSYTDEDFRKTIMEEYPESISEQLS